MNRKATAVIERKELDNREIAGFISTTDVDMVGDVVLPEGMDDSYYKNVKSLTLYHDSQQPVGVCRSYKAQTKGVWARFFLASTQAGNEALIMVREGVLGSFSIEWHPVTGFLAGPPTEEERRKYGTGCRNVFRNWMLTGVSLVPQPMNATANVVEKSMARLYELIAAEKVSPDTCKTLGWPAPVTGRVVSLPPARVAILPPQRVVVIDA